MDSSSVLRQHSRNNICSEYMRTKNEHNKMPADPKSSKHMSVCHPPNGDIENRDPGSSEAGRKVPARPGLSRLPVLAKSLRLQTPSDFPQPHHRWEEKPLAGKAKTKKPCTRPVPFSLSQPKSTRITSASQKPRVFPQSRTHAVHLAQNARNTHPKTKNINAKPSHPPAALNSNVGSTEALHQSQGKAENLPGQPVPSDTFKTPAILSNPLSSFPNNAEHQRGTPSSAQPDGAQTCSAHMDLLTLKDPSKKSDARQNAQTTTHGNFSKGSAGKAETFQPDHAALLRILRNEGVSSTPQSSKPYNYQPQRVSVMKGRKPAGPTTGPPKSAQFSPDAAALRSILQNEGVKPAGPLGATPKSSACPSGRSTSIYTAQRVPIRKNAAETAGGPLAASAASEQTPLKTWTPQRVPDTRHHPMSSMKWALSAHRSPFVGTPALRSCNTDLKPHKEEVVQRLFNDQEDEQKRNVIDEGAEAQAEQLPGQASAIESLGEEKADIAHSDEDEEQEQRIMGGRPFIQASQRESVIFFSTGKKLLRAPRFETQESSSHLEHYNKMQPPHEERPSGSDPKWQINPSVHSLHRDNFVQKSSALCPAVALLRKRLPPLEELRLDEEVATYVSLSASAAPGFSPPRPRCGNPLAAVLHFEDCTRFVPIDFDPPPAPSSPCSSPLRER